MQHHWTVSSWRQYQNFQPIAYAKQDQASLAQILAQLQLSKPLISVASVRLLNRLLERIYQQQDGFILQGGDCAECFNDIHQDHVHSQVQLLVKLSAQVSQQLGVEVLPIGRIAGQFAKPRSELLERVNEAAIPRYRGDMINGVQPELSCRSADPKRLLTAYALAENCLQYIASSQCPQLFTSHEALHLDFEQALTRYDQATEAYYDLSTHFPWVGMRTALPDSAHIEYLRGIANPIAIKVGPHISHRALLDLIERLNPGNKAGRLSLIYRLGQSHLKERLPRLIDAVELAGRKVMWLCDPMHGNTITTASGVKTRHCAEIIGELSAAIHLHRTKGVYLHGLHLEVTHKPVTECIGGGAVPTESDLLSAYDSPVDPRLNPEQAQLLLESMPQRLHSSAEFSRQC